MKENGGGVIINISAALHWSGSALQIHSGSAKAGVDTITKTLAVEWGPSKVRVAGIVPGYIQGTEGFERLGDMSTMNSKEKANTAFEKGTVSSQKEKLEEIAKRTVPIQRFGVVEDIANCALFIASPMASYVSGTNIVVDGAASLIYPNTIFVDQNFVELWASAKL